jgi:hypothetical protein
MPHFINIEYDNDDSIIGYNNSSVPDILDHINNYYYTEEPSPSSLSTPTTPPPPVASSTPDSTSSLTFISSSSSLTSSSSTQQQNGSTIAKTRQELMSDIEDTIGQIITSISLGEQVKLPFTSRLSSKGSSSSGNTGNSATSSTQTK